MDLPDDAGVLGEHPLPLVRRAGRRRRPSRRDDDCIERSGASDRRRQGGGGRPEALGDRAAVDGGGRDAPCLDRRRDGRGHLRNVGDDRAGTDRRGRCGAGLVEDRHRSVGCSPRWSPAAPRRVRRRRRRPRRAARASEVTSSLRTTSSSRGSSITATSDPPANSTRPRHHEKPSPTRWAPNGPSSSGAGIEPRESPPVAAPPVLPGMRSRAAVTMRVTAIGEMALTTTSGGACRPSCQVSGGHRPLGAAVGAGVGGAPSRARGDPEDPTVAGGGHDREGGGEDVEVAVEVDAEHRSPVLLAARAKLVGRVMPATLTTASSRPSSSNRPRTASRVGHRDRRGSGRPAGGDDATGGGLLGRRERLGPVERHERVHRDDEGALSAELLGDGGTDPAAAAGDGDDALPVARRVGCHGTATRSSSSRPSQSPCSSHCSSSSRYLK